MGHARKGFVYILASQKNGTLYIGMTSNLAKRIAEHKNDKFGGFTTRYNVKTLVYFEIHDRVTDAIAREKTMKKWRRQWKIDLIEKHNPDWRELQPPLW